VSGSSVLVAVFRTLEIRTLKSIEVRIWVELSGQHCRHLVALSDFPIPSRQSRRFGSDNGLHSIFKNGLILANDLCSEKQLFC